MRPMAVLQLTPHELLSTTRAVRKRLDLHRPVEREVLETCVRLAQQAPTASNQQHWGFVVVTDAQTRARLAELYRRGAEAYRSNPSSPRNRVMEDPDLRAVYDRIRSSSDYLAEQLHEVPVHVIPCIRGRPEGLPFHAQAGLWGSILPAVWSFMLAARSHGLGTCWTTFHLLAEREAADLLGIPYDQVAQTALIPVAYTQGGTFHPAPRQPLDGMLHWDRW
jgi:nitroreductase